MRGRAIAMTWLLGVGVGVALGLGACGDDGGAAVDATVAVDAAVDAAIDAPVACSREPCSILPQCGCDDTPATPVCDLDFTMPSAGATKCRADNFHGTETTVCTMTTTCGPEHVCTGRCTRYCDDDDDCPGPGGLCILPLLSQGQPIPGVKTCTTDCVPSDVVNATCPAGWACHLFREADGERRWLTNCEAPPSQGGELGDVCTTSSSCKPGLDCFSDGNGGRKCFANCVCPGGDCSLGVCPAGTGTCHTYAPPAMVGAAVYGRCFTL